MKLFAYACLAGSGSAQSGDYDDRGISSDYYEAVGASDYYEYDEFGNKKKKNKNQWFGQEKFGLDTFNSGTAVNTIHEPNTNYWDWATALNCWPANIEADQIVYANQLQASTTVRVEAFIGSGATVGTDLFPTQKWHNRAPQHVYGSYEILDRAHEASNTNPMDADNNLTANGGTNDGQYESNGDYSSTAHVKNGYFAGHGEAAGATDNLNLHQEDPVIRSGLGGLYQYGHDTWNNSSGNEAHNMDMDNNNIKGGTTGNVYAATTGTTPTRWTHYKQARHAGCLYEKSEWHYGYATYEQIFLATYFQAYGNFDLQNSTGLYDGGVYTSADTETQGGSPTAYVGNPTALSTQWVAAWDNTNAVSDNALDPYDSANANDDKQGTNKVEPIWWHFFNAHILPNPQNALCSTTTADLVSNHLDILTGDLQANGISYACPTVPVGDLIPGVVDTYMNPENSNAIPLVMANPAYEGLGYLNFIVEYKNRDLDVGEDYLEFIDSTPSMAGKQYYDGSSITTSNTVTNAIDHGDFRNRPTYREINNCKAGDVTQATTGNFTNGTSSMAAEQECTGWGENLGNWSGVHGMFYYDLYMGSWLVYPAVASARVTNTGERESEHYRTWVSYPFTAANASVVFNVNDYNQNFNGDVDYWSMALNDISNATANSSVTWSTDHDLVVSSFPHNNLGKDFRFNLRVLQGALSAADANAANTDNFFLATKTGANQIYRSYYFYKINQIDIRFPYFVAYALHHENRGMAGASSLTATDGRVSDGAPSGTDWEGTDGAEWGDDFATANKDHWCDNDNQCHARGQQWWNTLNNDIVHPLVYDAAGELYKHMDTDTNAANLAHNRNNIMTATAADADTMLDDYQFMHVSAASTRSNIIPPVDLGTHSPGVNKHNSTNNGGGEIEFHRIMGFIRKAEVADADIATNDALDGTYRTTAGVDTRMYSSADWCDHTGGHKQQGLTSNSVVGTMGDNILERTCGIEFRIIGLMNTYDERRGQRGTYQEIWVQLQYALGKGGRDGVQNSCKETLGHSGCTNDDHPIQSPHPYLHFMASEIISIRATCNTLNVNNPNRCSMMPMGPGETNNAAYGGK